MKKIHSNIFGFMVVVFLMFSSAGLVKADGMIIPHPHPDIPEIGYLGVKYHHVDVSIDNQYAETKVDQVFKNPYGRDLEGTYIFPLPEDSVISKFSMFVDGEELRAELLEKEKAREIYESIVRRMKDPALLEYVDRNIFKASVYPIPAYGEKRVKIEYSEVLKCENNVCTYNYPLDTEKFSSSPLESVVVSVEIKSSRPIKSVYSPSHKVYVKRVSDYLVKVSYEENDVTPDKNFELIYTLSDDDLGVDLIAHRLGASGNFMLLLSPKFDFSEKDATPKDMIFVLDTSGSMSGEKISQAKEALKFCVNRLEKKDRFNVIGFSDSIKNFREGLVLADADNVESALDFIGDFDSMGGTNIRDALLEAVEESRHGENPATIVFLTDGRPTVGVTETDSIVRDVLDAKGDYLQARIFVFGVGYDVNTHLLDRLSEESKGVSEYVTPDEDIEVKVSELYGKIESPLLYDLKLSFEGVEVSDVYPRELPDLYKGSQIIVFGRYTGSGNAKIKLEANAGSSKKELKYDAYFPLIEPRNSFIPRLWASRRIGYLLDEIRLHGEDDELIEEVVSLSRKYGIMTPYTSFLVKADSPAQSPIPMLDATRYFKSALSSEGFQMESGKQAVDNAIVVGGLKDNENSLDYESVQYKGEKTFLLKGGVWVDGEYAGGMIENKVKYGSDAYYQLVRDRPDFGSYLSLGEKVIFCDNGECFNIGGDGAEESGDVNVKTTTTLIELSGASVYTTSAGFGVLHALITLAFLFSAAVLLILSIKAGRKYITRQDGRQG